MCCYHYIIGACITSVGSSNLILELFKSIGNLFIWMQICCYMWNCSSIKQKQKRMRGLCVGCNLESY